MAARFLSLFSQPVWNNQVGSKVTGNVELKGKGCWLLMPSRVHTLWPLNTGPLPPPKGTDQKTKDQVHRHVTDASCRFCLFHWVSRWVTGSYLERTPCFMKRNAQLCHHNQSESNLWGNKMEFQFCVVLYALSRQVRGRLENLIGYWYVQTAAPLKLRK